MLGCSRCCAMWRLRAMVHEVRDAHDGEAGRYSLAFGFSALFSLRLLAYCSYLSAFPSQDHVRGIRNQPAEAVPVTSAPSRSSATKRRRHRRRPQSAHEGHCVHLRKTVPVAVLDSQMLQMRQAWWAGTMAMARQGGLPAAAAPLVPPTVPAVPPATLLGIRPVLLAKLVGAPPSHPSPATQDSSASPEASVAARPTPQRGATEGTPGPKSKIVFGSVKRTLGPSADPTQRAPPSNQQRTLWMRMSRRSLRQPRAGLRLSEGSRPRRRRYGRNRPKREIQKKERSCRLCTG
ncbi:hypothetical protein Esti_001148 [Eimeria stiedai]